MTPLGPSEKLSLLLDNSLLLVEDDEILRERLAAALRGRGFAVITANCIETGLEMVRASPPAFAVVDLRLTDGSGLSIVSEMRSARPDSRSIVMTGYGNIATAVSAAKLGANDYITKPVDADEITDALLTPHGSVTPPPAQPMELDEKEWTHISSVLAQCSNNISQAARLLNMHRRSLQRIVRRHEV
jgi:two-component system response regulator RegA